MKRKLLLTAYLFACFLIAKISAQTQAPRIANDNYTASPIIVPSSYYRYDNSGNNLLYGNWTTYSSNSSMYIPYSMKSAYWGGVTNFRVMFPPNYNPNDGKKYPLILLLHGAGEGGHSGCTSGNCADNNEKQLLWWGSEHVKSNNNGYPAIYLFVQSSWNYWTDLHVEGGAFYQFANPATGQPWPVSTPIKSVLDILDFIIPGGVASNGDKFNIDPNRVYVHGLSGGGAGTYDIACRRPDLFAAALPYSAGGDRGDYAANLVKYMGMWAWQGGTDVSPLPLTSQIVIQKYQSVSGFKRDKQAKDITWGSATDINTYIGNKRYSMVAKDGHGVWFDTYNHPDLYRWMFAQNKLNIVPFNDTTLTAANPKIKIGIQPGYAEYDWQYSANGSSYVSTLPDGIANNTNDINVFAPGFFRVRFRRSNLGWTNYSSPIQINGVAQPDTEAPTTPTGLTASSITQTGFTISWAASTDNKLVTGYDVFKNGVLVGTFTANSAIISGLSPATLYSMTVVAKDAAGNASNPAALSITTPDTQAPTAPTGLTAANIIQTGFTLTWIKSTDNVAVTGYDVFKNGTKVNASTITDTTYNLTGLTAATYSITVKAKDAAGNSSTASTALSVTTPDTQAPTAPTGLTASVITQTGFTLTWTKSTDNIAVTGYDVYKGASLVGTFVTNSAIISNLTAGTDYSFTIKAKDAAGNISNVSTALLVTTLPADILPPTVPTGLVASNIAPFGFTLTWSKSTDDFGVTGYDVFKNGVKTNINNITDTTFNFTGLAGLTTYSITVKAKDATGNISNASTALSVTTLVAPDVQAPSIPTGLAASSITQTSFNLNWTASTDNVGVVMYYVYKNGTLSDTTSTTSTFFSGLSVSTAYSITVKAKDLAGNISNASTVLTVTTADPIDLVSPSTPSGLAASNITQSGFKLTWTKSTDNVGVTGYDVYKDGAWVGSFATNSATISSLSPGTDYSMTVKAKDASGNISNASTALIVTTSVPFVDTESPSIPLGLASSAITQTSFTLTWVSSTDNVGVTGYDVYKDGTLVGTFATNSTTISSLTAATTYSMTVKAKDLAGNVSDISTALTVTTLTALDTQTPTIPAGLSASTITQTSFVLSWTPSTDNVGVTGYEVYKNGVLVGTFATNSATISSLTAATTYSMTVKAKDLAGNISNASTELPVTTGDAVGLGTGLLANYFNNISLTGTAVLTTIDPTVDFDWQWNSPVYPVAADQFSARWEGQVQAPVTGTYSFAVNSDDGVKLYINNVQITSNTAWSEHAPTRYAGSQTYSLTAGQKLAVKVEYYENLYTASMKLYWAYTGVAEQIIPKIYLYPALNVVARVADPETPAVANAKLAVSELTIAPELLTNSDLHFSPNPTNGSLTADYYMVMDGDMQMVISDILGKVIVDDKKKLYTGKNEIKVDLSGKDPGVYAIQLLQGETRIIKRVILTK